MFAIIGATSNGVDQSTLPSQTWDALAEKLLNSVVLERPSKQFSQDLRTALSHTPMDTQLRWVELLRARGVNLGLRATCTCCSSSATPALALGYSQSVACSSCSAELQPPSDLLANRMLDAKRAAQVTGVPKGSPCTAALNQAFGPLCTVSDTILVMDRFVVTDALRANATSFGSSGLQRLVRMADQSKVREIELFTTSGSKYRGARVSAADIPSHLATLLGPGSRFTQVTVTVLPEGVARNELHDRWIGFSWGGLGMVSWHLGKGLTQFDGRKTRGHHALGRQADGLVSTLATELRPRAVLSARV